MNTQNQSIKTEFSIHPATRMGHVSLSVANLENQIAFYTKVLGFTIHWREANKAAAAAPRKAAPARKAKPAPKADEAGE